MRPVLIGDIAVCRYTSFSEPYFFKRPPTELSPKLFTSAGLIAWSDQFSSDVVDRVLLTYAKTAENQP